ncbi:MAG: sulfur carrier protein ThiS [Planctomycetaceae bacterium]|nr:sulfur carrier protein ThiS [Planctomycetaceae bacterium]
MKLRINGKERTVHDGATLAELLEQLELAGKYVAVERNKEVVPFRTYAETVLAEGDCLEIVTLVGGG